MILIVYAHPAPLDNKKSHNARILRETINWARIKKESVRVIDLYRDNFDPALSIEEWEGTEPLDAPLIQKYQAWMKEANGIVFIYPVWWYNCPAVMKGFVDRVISHGFAFRFKKDINDSMAENPLAEFLASFGFLYPIFKDSLPIEKLLNGKKALVINTFDGPRTGSKLFKNPQCSSMDLAVLEFCGIDVKRVEWFNARKKTDTIPKSVWKKIENELSWVAKK